MSAPAAANALRDLDRILAGDAALDPVGRRDAHRHRLVLGPRRRASPRTPRAGSAAGSPALPPYSSVRRFISGVMKRTADSRARSAARPCRSRTLAPSRSRARTRRARRPCPRASSAAAPGCCGDQGTAEGPITCQLPSSSGSSMPSQPSLVEPLGPEWPSCRQILASVCRCTKSTIRVQAATCSSWYMPAQPGVIRPSGVTQVISVKTSPAPPCARAPRCTRWKSPAHAVLAPSTSPWARPRCGWRAPARAGGTA